MGEVAPGWYVVISVTDTGIGMPAEVRERAFDPFVTTKPGGRGTGLGLSMVYGFCKQSKGHAEIISVPGSGTTVRLCLPQDRRDGARRSAEGSAGREPLAQGERILLVEDDQRVRRTTMAQLQELGYGVVEAGDSHAALRILEQDPVAIDLIFTDVVIPGGMPGHDLAREARVRRPVLKALLTSGYPGDSLNIGMMAEEGFGWLRKPYSRQELARVVRDALAS